ncbi:MAG: hypothetical protein AAF639_30075 [Chloroflexota bacterium]
MVIINNKEEVIAAALALDKVCYTWSITLDPETAITFAEQCQEMNAAAPAALVELIGHVNEYIPRSDYGPTNPNTGEMHHDIAIGCDRGRTIDVIISKSQLKQWSADDWRKCSTFLNLAGRALYADVAEVTKDDEREYVFSYWWD